MDKGLIQISKKRVKHSLAALQTFSGAGGTPSSPHAEGGRMTCGHNLWYYNFSFLGGTFSRNPVVCFFENHLFGNIRIIRFHFRPSPTWTQRGPRSGGQDRLNLVNLVAMPHIGPNLATNSPRRSLADLFCAPSALYRSPTERREQDALTIHY